jgi:hypothetical protein
MKKPDPKTLKKIGVGAVTLVLAPTLVIVLGALGIGQFHIGDSAKATSSEDSSIERGSGTDPTTGGGTTGGRSFSPQSALVFADQEGLEVAFYDHPWDCASVTQFYSQIGDYDVEVVISKNPAYASSLPVNKAISPETVWFNYQSGPSASVSTGVPSSKLVLTRIDTRSGGVWHGILSVPSFTQDGKTFAYQGTFAARWCST